MINLAPLIFAARRRKSKGFTLLEVMIATSVLALGAVMIHQSFFIALDSFSYYSTLLKVTPWMDEKIWEAQNEIKHRGHAARLSYDGKVQLNNKEINWSLSYNSLDENASLFAIELGAFWEQGSRRIKLNRSANAFYVKK